MYDNIGRKIKGLAETIFIVEAVLSAIVGIALWAETGVKWCALILFCGPIIAWVSSWLLYGFGEIIDKLCEIEDKTRLKTPNKKKEEQNSKVYIENPTGDYDDTEFSIPQVVCPNCGMQHDFDYPKCPKCKYEYDN